MQRRIAFGITAALVLIAGALSVPVLANKNFAPDWTFKGSALTDWKPLGQAAWRAENGEIVGTPKSPEGGWLILNKSFQDVQFAADFRCTGGCMAGVLVRAESTPQGLKGVYVALPGGQDPAAFALTLDEQGHELGREPLPPAGGQIRFLPPLQPGRGAGGRGAGRGTPVRPLPPGSPYSQPDYSYKPDQWNKLEILMDANILRTWVNDGPEAGVAGGQADDDKGRYGPIALYVGGAGEVRFKQVEVKDVGRRVLPPERVSKNFRMQRLNDFYYGWSAAVADINHDGIPDIVAGPNYYLGPDYHVSREIYLAEPSAVGSQYTPAMINFAYDFTGDGWPDVLVTESRPIYLYVNPKNQLRRWDKYAVLPQVSSETVVFKDIDGDGKPDVLFVGGGTVNWASPDPANPTAPWTLHRVSEPGYAIPAQHGLGVGDINGDGRMDIVSPYGWWEQPAAGAKETPWPYHPVALGRWPRAGASPGGAEMGVYDVNGDGLNDIVTSLGAHGWGLAWYEQKRDSHGSISFVEHIIMDDMSTRNAGGVTFSEAHATAFADVDGDGIPDLIVGKRVYSHNESYVDPDPYGPAVLYWYRTVRNPKAPGGAEFVPELIHNRSGVGSTIAVADLNHDGALDIITSATRGTFIFWGIPKSAGRAPSPPAKPR